MAEQVIMPKLGFDMAEGTLVRWVKKEGEKVNKGDVLAEIETDKATVEVEASASGVVQKHLVREGTSVPVGSPIAVIGAPGEKVEAPPAPAPAPSPAPAQRPPRPVADSTPPSPATVPAREAAAAPRPAPPRPSETPIGAAPAPQAPVQEKAAPPKPAPAPAAGAPIPPAKPQPEPAPEGRLPGGVRASPVARRVAEEAGVDLSQVAGSGPGGRIVKRDVEASLEAPAAAMPEAAAPEAAAAPARAPEERAVGMSKLRQAIGKRMAESKRNVPHFYVTADINMGPLMELRSKINAMLPEAQKASVNDFVVRAAALALRDFPNLNASVEGDRWVQHAGIHVGIAVAVEGGLLTVVVRDADRKTISAIAAESKELVGRVRAGKVRPDDVTGSTFTVSNLGMYQVDNFVAIINPPEVAILAVGTAQQVPVVENGQLVVGTRMKATVSADHRATDGAEAARFMQAVRKLLEEPMRLLI